MLTSAEEFWLRWHAEHSQPELAEQARLVLRAGGSPAAKAPANLGASNEEVLQVLQSFTQQRLNAFKRPELKPEHLLALFPDQAAHGTFVAGLARRLFESTQALHGLPTKARRLLLAAALLHPIAAPHTASQNGQPGVDLLDYPALVGFGGREQDAITCLLKFQRKGYRPDRDRQFKRLRPNQQAQMRALAAILQAAEALDESRSQSTTLVAADLRPEGANLRLAGPSAEGDAAALAHQSWLWRAVFNLPLKATVVPADVASQPAPAATLPDRDEPIAAAIQRALATALQDWQACQPGISKGEPAAHAAMLAAGIRLRASLDAFGTVLKGKATDRVESGARHLEKLAEAAAWHETAVADVQAYRSHLPAEAALGLKPLEASWELAREKCETELRQWLECPDAADLFACLVRLAEAPPVRNSRDASVRAAAGPLLEELLEVLTSREAAVTVEHPKSLRRYRQALAQLVAVVQAFGGTATLGDEAARLLADVARFQTRLDRLRLSLKFDAAIADYLDAWAEHQARHQTPQLFGAQPVLAYRRARKAQWARLRHGLPQDWRPVRANRLRRRLASLLRALASS